MNQFITKEKVYKKNIMLIILLIFVLLIPLCLQKHIITAKETVQYEKTFITIEIHNGDSLYSIASSYTKPGQDVYTYIEEVKEMNNLTSDNIHSGCYLVIPAYNKIEIK